jgi:hypothetical protein
MNVATLNPGGAIAAASPCVTRAVAAQPSEHEPISL